MKKIELPSNKQKIIQGEIKLKPWGREEIIHTGEYTVKKLTMFKGKQCSVQYHPTKDETVIVFKGKLYVIFVDDKVKGLSPAEITKEIIENDISKENVLEPGQTIIISPGTIHYMKAPEGKAEYFESSTPDNETVRVFDPYKYLRKDLDIAI